MVYDASVISEMAAWTTISGSFVADSNYAYIIVGNLFSDSLTDTVFEGEAKYVEYAYYYVGYVSVVPDSTSSTNNVVSDNNISIYPNPSSGKFHISGTQKITAVQLYDMTGRLVFTQKMEGSSATLDMGSLANGVYNARLMREEDAVEKKLIIAR